jgi:hypothetical protein
MTLPLIVDNSKLDYFLTPSLDYERRIRLGLWNFNRRVYFKKGAMKLVLSQR